MMDNGLFSRLRGRRTYTILQDITVAATHVKRQEMCYDGGRRGEMQLPGDGAPIRRQIYTCLDATITQAVRSSPQQLSESDVTTA